MPKLHFQLEDLVGYFGETPQKEIFERSYTYAHGWRIKYPTRMGPYRVSDGILTCDPSSFFLQKFNDYIKEDIPSASEVDPMDRGWNRLNIVDPYNPAHYADSERFQKGKLELPEISEKPEITRLKIEEAEKFGLLIRSLDVTLMFYEGEMNIPSGLKSKLHTTRNTRKGNVGEDFGIKVYYRVLDYFKKNPEMNTPLSMSDPLRRQIQRLYKKFHELDDFYQINSNKLPPNKTGWEPRRLDFFRKHLFDLFGLEKPYVGNKIDMSFSIKRDFPFELHYTLTKLKKSYVFYRLFNSPFRR